MGGSGLEPVTPSYDSWGSSRAPHAKGGPFFHTRRSRFAQSAASLLAHDFRDETAFASHAAWDRAFFHRQRPSRRMRDELRRGRKITRIAS